MQLGVVTSIQDCYLLASANRYSIFGLQNGGECWVSNDLQKAEDYGQCGSGTTGANKNCNCSNKLCANGDSCGDAWANALYQITKYQYRGCYGDSSARAMPLQLGYVNSINDCYNLALRNKYTVFGLQYGGQCWVSNDLTAAERYGQCSSGTTGTNVNCNCSNMQCPNGDNCGDSWANAVYEISPVFRALTAAPTAVAPDPISDKPSLSPTKRRHKQKHGGIPDGNDNNTRHLR